MVFKTKRDPAITLSLVLVEVMLIFFAFIGFLLPSPSKMNHLFTFLIFLVLASLFFWLTADIKYILKKQFLLVKGGPIQSRIAYHDICHIKKTTDVLAGYRLLGSADSIEIFYRGRRRKIKSVKISPSDKILFLKELREKIPDLYIEHACWE